MARSKTEIKKLIQGAMGEVKADLIVTGGRLVNVYSGEIVDGMEVAIVDGRVCYVGPSAAHARGDATEILDAHGLYVSPGFIDGHTHIGHFCRPYEYLQAYVAHGTTALMASGDEFAAVYGYRGVKLFMEEVGAHPLRVYTLVSMVAPQDPLLCRTASYTDAEVAELLTDPRILGLGEIVSWLRLIQCDDEIVNRMAMAWQAGKIIHGHTAGARDQKLCAIGAAGVSSCHEPIREQDVLDRLRLGYWTMLREGSLRQDLEGTLKPILERGVNTQRLILVTDSMSPDDVASGGHMDFVLRRAVALGMAPVEAIKAVTLNPATYSGLEQDIGGIAPGRFADIALIEDLKEFRVHSTLISGQVVAQEGESLVAAPPMALPSDIMKDLRIAAVASPELFQIRCRSATARIRVMELLNLNITAERILEIDARNGFLEADLSRDLLKVAVFDRHGSREQIAIGFLKGFGARVGAVGTTTTIDENTLLVAGSSDADMALCVNALVDAGGGIAIVDRGRVLEKMDHPAGGMFALDSWKEVGGRLNRIHRCLKERGSPFERAIYALCFLTFVTLPSLRITARGLVNAKERTLVSLFAEPESL